MTYQIQQQHKNIYKIYDSYINESIVNIIVKVKRENEW